MQRIAMLTYHSCPTATLGERDAGGMNVYVLYLTRWLAKLGVEVDIFSRRHDPSDPQIEIIAPGARLIHLDAGPPQATKEELSQYLPIFQSKLEEFARAEASTYDVIHSHYWLSGHVGMALAETWGVPHIATFHTLAEIKRLVLGEGVDAPQRAATERRVATNAQAIVVSDQHEVDALVRLYEAPRQSIHVIPCGVDAALFRPMDRRQAREALSLDGNPTLLFVGRLDPLKGLDVLLHIIAALEDSTVRLLVVGGDPATGAEGRRLAALAETLGLAAQVRFEGVVPQENLPLYYNAADALVMPSYYESFGLAALESMACGTPVVAARVGGLASLVRDWDTGCLVAGHCPDSFAQRLEVILRHPDLRDSMGQAARRYAEEFSWSAVAREMLALYQGLPDARCVAAGMRG
jgi:D-inositol-3-phosphate glycosyltransferase